jgi:7-carboxy-7-deazaguanine synthase
MHDLQVLEIFDSLQGEGYWTGTPMTFVRLAGCNAPELGLDCVRWCDTAGSWDPRSGETLTAAEVVERVHFPRLCLTGGEPLLQADAVAALVAEAHRCGIRVHLETNGTVAPSPVGAVIGTDYVPGLGGWESDETFDWTVVSPKPPEYRVAPGWTGLMDELKLVVDDSMDTSTAERLASEHREAIVSVQPVWRGGSARESEQRALRLVLEHPDWRLSLQTHKFLGIR